MSTSQINYQLIKQELADGKTLAACATQMGVVGDETRIKICYLLCNYPRLSVTHIADLVGVSVSAASHSLRRLRENDLVSSQREARTIYYSLKPSPFTNLLQNFLSITG